MLNIKRKNDIVFYKCFFGFHLLPRVRLKGTRYGWALFVSWLGGCCVWSRIEKTNKLNRRI